MEKFPVYYHGEDILRFEFNLQAKMAVAIARWNGNKKAKLIDLIREILQGDIA